MGKYRIPRKKKKKLLKDLKRLRPKINNAFYDLFIYGEAKILVTIYNFTPNKLGLV